MEDTEAPFQAYCQNEQKSTKSLIFMFGMGCKSLYKVSIVGQMIELEILTEFGLGHNTPKSIE